MPSDPRARLAAALRARAAADAEVLAALADVLAAPPVANVDPDAWERLRDRLPDATARRCAKEIPVRRVGRTIVARARDIDAWIDRQQVARVERPQRLTEDDDDRTALADMGIRLRRVGGSR